MRVKNTTQRFEVFVRDLQESFWGDFQGRTREMLKKLLEADAEQQMADYLGLKWLERRAPEVAELIRQAFLRGISTRQVGRVVAILTGEPVSAQTVSKLTRVLDRAVRAFHQRPLGDDWAYVVLDGVWVEGAAGLWAA